MLVFSSTAFSQDYQPRKNLGFFGTLETNIGFDLASMFKNSQAKTEYERYTAPPGKFNYGVTSQVGYQPISWFALAGGMRYSYIDPNFHLLYWTVQPYFIINDKIDDDYIYLSPKFGSQTNQSAVNNAKFIGINLGKIEAMGNNLAQQYAVSLETQVIGGESTFFIGPSYGLTLFSNSRY